MPVTYPREHWKAVHLRTGNATTLCGFWNDYSRLERVTGSCFTEDASKVTCAFCQGKMAEQVESAFVKPQVTVTGPPGAAVPPGVLLASSSLGGANIRVVDGGYFDENGELVVEFELA